MPFKIIVPTESGEELSKEIDMATLPSLVNGEPVRADVGFRFHYITDKGVSNCFNLGDGVFAVPLIFGNQVRPYKPLEVDEFSLAVAEEVGYFLVSDYFFRDKVGFIPSFWYGIGAEAGMITVLEKDIPLHPSELSNFEEVGVLTLDLLHTASLFWCGEPSFEIRNFDLELGFVVFWGDLSSESFKSFVRSITDIYPNAVAILGNQLDRAVISLDGQPDSFEASESDVYPEKLLKANSFKDYI